jgi:hypothetical protein
MERVVDRIWRVLQCQMEIVGLGWSGCRGLALVLSGAWLSRRVHTAVLC